MASLTWHGHSCFTLATDEGSTIMFDPFLDENPAANIRKKDVTRLDYILCSHGHGDHFMDAIPLAKQTGATIVGVFELVSFAAKNGIANGQGMNVGGGAEFPFGYAKLTPALHSGSVHGDDQGVFTTQAAGFWIDLKPAHGEKGGKRLYHAGDTALMMDMLLLKGQVDVALLPIGDLYTMGPEDAARAVEFIEPKVVIPMHYNTWPPIAQDPHAFAKRVGNRAKVHVLEPGQSYDF